MPQELLSTDQLNIWLSFCASSWHGSLDDVGRKEALSLTVSGTELLERRKQRELFFMFNSFIHSKLKPTEVWILPNRKTFLTNWTWFLSKRWRAVTSVDTNGHMTAWKWDFMVVCVHGPGVFIGRIDHGLLTPPVHKKAGAHFIRDVSTFINYGIPNTLPPNNITLEPTHVRVGDAHIEFRDY